MDARTIYETICLEQMQAQDTGEPTHFMMSTDTGLIAQGFIYDDSVSINLMTGVYVRLEFTRMELDEDGEGYIYLFNPTDAGRGYVGMIACGEITAFEVD